MIFKPYRVFFEEEALEFPLGRQLYDFFVRQEVQTGFIATHNRVTGIPGKTSQESYRESKRTLVVGVRKSLDFQTCKPSAHYQLPLATSCPGQCEYCYLATTLGKKPYIRVYVNVNEIIEKAREYIIKRVPEITVFEGAATSDPIPIEPYTRSLEQAISFFAREEFGRFRFVTKFTQIDQLLNLDHRNHTTIRFSINAKPVIRWFEHHTSGLRQRLQAAERAATAGYPVGFLIAPIFIFEGWQREYEKLLALVAQALPRNNPTFELISYRFTPAAKKRILDIFPGTSLPMEEESRVFKFGQFGYGKYVYSKSELEQLHAFFQDRINSLFPSAQILYFV